jgi:uncharacterized protein with ParB-like and HNH nuclease domain
MSNTTVFTPSETEYSPAKIVEKNVCFTIPIYQRLFEWNEENILVLLNDLKRTFNISNDNDYDYDYDYYIGMLTSTQSNELVDGQQRFIVMMLLGSVLQEYDDRWKKFLSKGKRIRFIARQQDEMYLQKLINEKEEDSDLGGFVNIRMRNGKKFIKEYLNKIEVKKEYLNKIEVKENFAMYIYEHLCFFVSNLPDNYSPMDLNKYFERMNSSGKNLEPHEILKVKLLSNMGEGNKYMQLWNLISDVDTLLIRKRTNETEDDLNKRKRRAFEVKLDDLLNENILNGMRAEEEEEEKSIVLIDPSSTEPKAIHSTERESRCALRFPYLLLQTLYFFKKIDEKRENIDDFFNIGHLLETFAKYLPFEVKNVKDKDIISAFMEKLVRCRLAMDICFVRPTDYGYALDMGLSEGDTALKDLMMFESMLYVSSSNLTNYQWFNWLMSNIESLSFPEAEELLKELKIKDREKHESQIPEWKDMYYDNIDRYWFWRLDYYIWENRKEIFKNPKNENGINRPLEVAENYIFRSNRSIEHIAPQTPKSNSNVKWEGDDEVMNSFGNLAMISQGLNSSLSNESYEVKMAHVQSFINGSKTGSIESLKLLVVYLENKTWDKDAIKNHGEKMYGWLKKEFI